MSGKITVKVNCHYSGQFKTDNGVLKYVDGVIEVFEVDSLTIFQDILLKMLGKRVNNLGRMWYKLPFEELSDRQPLWENVDSNKNKLVSKGRWMGEVDIFFEKAEEEPLEAAGEKEKDVAEKAIVDDSGDDSGDGKSDAGLSKLEESYNEYEIVDNDVGIAEEDIQVFNNDNYEEQIPDDDEVYPATDDESDDEEEQTERLVKKGLPDGVFSLRQLFNSGSEFKKNIIRYILKTRRNVVYARWEKDKLETVCKAKGCTWSIYCAIENPEIGGALVAMEHQDQDDAEVQDVSSTAP